MLIKALSTFTAFDGEMKVFNKGDKGELGDVLAAQFIESGFAEPYAQTDKPQLDHDGDGKAGGSKPKAERAAKPAKAEKPASPLAAARKAYRAVFGKNAGPKWSAEEIEAKVSDETLRRAVSDTVENGIVSDESARLAASVVEAGADIEANGLSADDAPPTSE